MFVIRTEKYLAIFICIAVCFQRLSMAIGSIFGGLSIAIFLYLLYKHSLKTSGTKRIFLSYFDRF